jgi:hypothetical protein
VLAATIASLQLQATVRPVPASLKSIITQDVGKTAVSITYSRPNANGREIFGALVPYGEVWRTGANQATTIELGTDVTLGEHNVAKGRYSLFTIPGEDSWTIILNTLPDQFGAFSYDAATDLLRFDVPVESQAVHVETFEIGFTHVANNTATIDLSWANSRVSIPISVTDESNNAEIQAEIDRDIIGGAEPNWGNYGEAARFYVKQDKDLATAVVWYDKCNELNPEAFWIYYEKARLLAKLGRKDEAVAAANAGIAAAKAAKHQGGQDMGKGVLADIGGA